MNFRKIIIVPFITFGPLFMMMSVDYKQVSLHAWATAGALMLAVGCGLIYIMTVNQEQQLKEIQLQLKQLSERK
jgi:hypothetical protein